jgi:integrase
VLGLRRSEVLGLRRQDIDFEAGPFTPVKQVQREKGVGLVPAHLRHSRISMTMDVHTHVVGDSEREAVAMLAELLEDPLIG